MVDSRRSLLTILAILFVCRAEVQGQEPPDTFGPSFLSDMPVRAGSILRVIPSEDGADRVIVLSPRGGRIYTVQTAPGGRGTLLDSLVIPFPVAAVPAGPSVVSSDAPALFIRTDTLLLYSLEDNAGRTLRLRKIFSPDRRPTYAYRADLNGDGLEDLLLVDEEEPGLLPLYRTKKGEWRAGKIAAPDLLVRRVATLHLNNDGLLDILAYDWVRSELHLVYGVGRERFLDQGGFPVDGSVDGISVDPVSEEHPLRVTLLDAQRSRISYREMDERGDLIPVTQQDIRDSVREMYDRSGDGATASTFILVSDSSLSIMADAYVAQTPTLTTVALPGRVISSWLADTSSVSVLLSGGIYDRVRRYSALRAAADSVVIAVPDRPVGVIVRDYNADGHDDMAFVSGRSGIMTFVWGRSNGTLFGAEDLVGPSDPVTVIGQSAADAQTRFYATHDAPPSVSVTEVEWQDLAVTTSRIPVQGRTELIGELRSADGRSMLSAIHRSGPRKATFATYERVRQDSFLEQTLELSPPAVLYGASFGFLDADSVADAILLYRPDDSSAVSLGISYGDSATQPPRLSVRTTLPVRDPRIAYMWQTDADRDSLPDLIVVFPTTARQVYLLRSTRDSLYALASRMDTLVTLDHRQDADVFDADGDGYPDLLAIVRERGGLGWWRNRGDGSFAPWELLVHGRDLTSFAPGAFFGKGQTDLVVTRRRMNIATIYNARILPWGEALR